MKKRLITISIVVVVLGLLAYPLLKGKGELKPEFITTEIQKGSIISEVTATGTLNPLESIDVGTQVSGIISKLYVDFNDRVHRGQVIAQIDTINLHSSVVDAEANLSGARAQHENLRKEYLRFKELLEKKAVAQSDYDQAFAAYRSAESTVRSAEAGLKKARTNLQYATITAPIDGVIISRDVNKGQTVAASFTTPKLFTIANDLTKMQLLAKVDEADIGQVKVGQAVKFTVESYPEDVFKGTVNQIRLQPTTTSNVVTYTVVIDAPNPDLKLLPGMNTNLSILVKEQKDVLTIPLSAFSFNPLKDTTVKINSADTIWTIKNKVPIALKVIRGTDDGSFVRISGEGVREGIKVIIGSKIPEGKKMKTFLPGPPKNRRPSM